MTLLQLVQAAVSELGLTPVFFVVGNTDPLVTQYLALANQVGVELATGHEWQKMDKQHTFNVKSLTLTGTTADGSAVITGISSTSEIEAGTWQVTGTGIPQDTYIDSVDSATQVTMDQFATASGTVSLTFMKTIYVLPADWDYQVNRTQWDRTNHWELVGPKSAQEWQWMKSGIVASGPRIRYRILGGKFQIWPLDVADETTISYEYMSTSWVIATGDTTPSKQLFTLDSDECVFRDRLMINGIKLRLFETKGFDTAAFQRRYDDELSKAMAQDAGAPTLSLAPTYTPFLISTLNIPDGNWPG